MADILKGYRGNHEGPIGDWWRDKVKPFFRRKKNKRGGQVNPTDRSKYKSITFGEIKYPEKLTLEEERRNVGRK